MLKKSQSKKMLEISYNFAQYPSLASLTLFVKIENTAGTPVYNLNPVIQFDQNKLQATTVLVHTTLGTPNPLFDGVSMSNVLTDTPTLFARSSVCCSFVFIFGPSLFSFDTDIENNTAGIITVNGDTYLWDLCKKCYPKLTSVPITTASSLKKKQ